MRLKITASFRRSAAALGGFWLAFCGTPPAPIAAAQKAPPATNSAAALVAEVRHSFTLHGKTIPPEIFRDFGDGDLANSGTIWVTVDAAAAIDSNLYFDPIRADGRWRFQKKQRLTTDIPEETAYRFYGSTANGLLVVLASYNGGGSGTFYTLHIVDVAAGAGFDIDGRGYQRINLDKYPQRHPRRPLGGRAESFRECRACHHDTRWTGGRQRAPSVHRHRGEAVDDRAAAPHAPPLPEKSATARVHCNEWCCRSGLN